MNPARRIIIEGYHLALGPQKPTFSSRPTEDGDLICGSIRRIISKCLLPTSPYVKRSKVECGTDSPVRADIIAPIFMSLCHTHLDESLIHSPLLLDNLNPLLPGNDVLTMERRRLLERSRNPQPLSLSPPRLSSEINLPERRRVDLILPP